jgi:hypothetical protein
MDFGGMGGMAGTWRKAVRWRECLLIAKCAMNRVIFRVAACAPAKKRRRGVGKSTLTEFVPGTRQVWSRLRSGIGAGIGVTPPGIDWCIIFQTNQLPAIDFAGS